MKKTLQDLVRVAQELETGFEKSLIKGAGNTWIYHRGRYAVLLARDLVPVMKAAIDKKLDGKKEA